MLPNIRKLFIPDEGMEFFDIDLDSADLRIVVAESDCREMQSMLDEGLKPYVEIAKEHYRDPSITKHHPAYKTFKSLCHATNYLGGARELSRRLGFTVAEIETIQKWYFGKFPEIRRWQEDFKRSLASKGFVSNIFGYREYNFNRLEGNVFNEFIAWLPQSTIACLINRGYRNIHTNEPDIQVLLQVHDSLAGQFPAHLRDYCRRRIVDHCSVELPYPKPIVIPVEIKTSTISWGDCI